MLIPYSLKGDRAPRSYEGNPAGHLASVRAKNEAFAPPAVTAEALRGCEEEDVSPLGRSGVGAVA